MPRPWRSPRSTRGASRRAWAELSAPPPAEARGAVAAVAPSAAAGGGPGRRAGAGAAARAPGRRAVTEPEHRDLQPQAVAADAAAQRCLMAGDRASAEPHLRL